MPAILLIVVRWNAGPGLDADDFAQYLLHARALLEGRPYAETGYIWSPYAVFVGPGAYPPGVPLVLAVVFLVTGFSVFAAGVVMALSFVLFTLFAGLWVAREEGLTAGLATTLLLGLQEPIHRFASTVNSDLPFCAALWALIVLADRPGRWSWPRVAAITALGLFAIATRTVGGVLIPVAALVALARRRELGWRAAVPPAVWSLVALAGAAATGMGRGLVPVVLYLVVQQGPNIAAALQTYRVGVSETLLYPFPWDLANATWHVAGAFLIVPALVTWVRAASTRFALFFGVVYGGVLAVLPVVGGRFLWPLAPLLLLGLFRGLALVGRALGRWTPVRASVLVPAFAAALAVGGTARLLMLPPPGRFEDLPESRALFAAITRESQRGPMRVVFVKPRSLTLATGVSAAGVFATTPPAMIVEFRRLCVTHVVVGDPLGLLPEEGLSLRRAVRLRQALFTPVYGDAAHQLLRFEANGCQGGSAGRQ